jgi:hypothetical protein
MSTKTSEPTHYILGKNARDLRVVTARNNDRLTCPSRAGGTNAEMEALLRFSVKNWTRLPHGREIEEAARLIH